MRLDRPRHRAGGVCVYAQRSLKTKVLKDLSGISSSGFHQLWIQVQHKKLKSFLLCVTYRTPDCPVSCFVNDFMDQYLQALTQDKLILIVGDLNCNLLINSYESRALDDLCWSLNMKQLINQPTRVTSTSESLIDVIMTSSSALVTESGVVKTHISDHYLVYATLNLKMPKPQPTYVIARSYKNYDPESFVNELAQVPWHENAVIDDTNEKVEHFNEIFFKVLERHAPVRKKKIRRRQCPFVDQDIKALMEKRDQSHRVACESGAVAEWVHYRWCRNEVKKRLRDAEKEYVQSEMNNIQSTSAKWKIIRNCIPSEERSRPVYSRNKKELANEFNEFFTSVGARAAAESKRLALINDLPKHESPSVKIIPKTDEFRFRTVTTLEIRKIIQSFPSNKAPGKDKLHMNVIKDALPAILSVLTDMINRSLLTSVFPSVWKESEVVPLLKEGDHEIPNNNRPVSLLPALSKICERAALNQLSEYMTRRNCLTEHQNGNKKQHSTETLNIFMSDMIFEAIDRKQVTALVLLDLSKAFDSIDHLILLHKLLELGVSREAMEWFRSYLSDRSQRVRIGHEVSDTCKVVHGVPQGSVLGPVLFNIYINDLPAVPNMCSLKSYVDDSQLYLSFPVKETETAEAQLTSDLQRIAAWCCTHSLLINPDKTKLLLLGTPQMLAHVPEDFGVTLLGKEIQPSHSAKDLGVVMDSHLSFNEHVTDVVSKCVGSLCQINRVKHLFDKPTLITIMNSLVFSKLFYCSSVWSSTTKKNIARLQKIQNFAARIVTGAKKFDRITPALKELHWLPVAMQLEIRDIIMAFKCIRGLAPPSLCNKFKTRAQVHTCNTRHKDRINVPFFKSTTGQRSFVYRAARLWNNLPQDITTVNSLAIFKTRIKSRAIKNFLEQ